MSWTSEIAHPGRILERHADDLLVRPLLVRHVEDPDDPHADAAAGERRLADEDERVQGVAVASERPFDEAVVRRVRHGGEEPAVEHDRPELLVELVLVPRPGRHLDEDDDVGHDRRLTEARDPLDQQLEERVGVDVDPDVDVGRSPVRSHRSTTVRPRQRSETSSTSTFRQARLHEPGPDDVRDRDRVVDRRTVPAVRPRGGSG